MGIVKLLESIWGVKLMQDGLFISEFEGPSSDGLASSRATVVLLHGLFGKGKNLSSVARALSKHFRVLLVDLPNHGLSPDYGEMDFVSMVAILQQRLDELSIARVKILGHSLGGKLAMSFALSYPQQVEQLLVADIAPVQYPPYHQTILDALLAIDLTTMKSRREVDVYLSKTIPEASTRQFLLQSLKVVDKDLQWQFNLRAINDNYPKLCEAIALGGREPYIGPALFVGGERSEYTRPAYAQQTRTLFPNFSYSEVLAAGHWLHAEKPAQFNLIATEFFAEL